MSTLTSLPPPLLAYVLEFTLPGFTLELAPQSRFLPLKQLKNVALVSKRMLASTRTLVDEYHAATYYLNLDDPDLIGRFPARGSLIRDLRVQFKKRRYHIQEPGTLETPIFNWDAILGSMKGLKRLNLAKIPQLSRYIPEVLEAASTYCLNLECLILPEPSEFQESEQRLQMERLTASIIRALERWHSKGYGGGLRQVRVPICPDENLYRHSTALMNGVAKYCPRIEYFDSCDGDMTVGDARSMWFVSLETWEMFNASCTALKQFDFALVPFADPFFRVFGAYVKPDLKELSLSANPAWDYEQYFRDVGSSGAASDQSTSRPGYSVLATTPSITLKGCPALTTLFIHIDFHRNTDPTQGRYVNADLFGDTFWEAAAVYCPVLEFIEMLDSSNCNNYNVWPIQTLTGRTLLALASLKRLSAAELAPARLTGKDILEYISCVSRVEDITGKQRDIHIRIGGHQHVGFSMPSFYSEILALLILLSRESEDSLGAATCRQRPIMHLWNPYSSKVNAFWRGGYLNEHFRPALQAVKEVHPSLGIAVYIQGRDGGQFNRIERVTLDWSHAHERLFFDMVEDEDAQATYFEASIYEMTSDNEGEESDVDEGA
ncbi:hypothetical protein ON010_g3314 [Phytophthora cinnamomi]|nr:hypothetical protein ON010_g3314 [Phytophthora cinnamomi]